MTRWQAITEIVKSFNDKDKPLHALAALFVLMMIPLAVVLLTYATGTRISPMITQRQQTVEGTLTQPIPVDKRVVGIADTDQGIRK